MHTPGPLQDRRAIGGGPRSRIGDLPALGSAPLRWEGRDWGRLGLGVGLVCAVGLVDDKVDGLFDRHRSPTTTRIASGIRPLGQEAGLALLGAAWLVGSQVDNPDLVELAQDGLEATIISAGLITPALKAAVGRSRPRSGRGRSSFGVGGASFPSGEATEAFALASVASAHVERPWLKVAVWSVAGLIGMSRLEHDAHWASDVVAGALIGTAVGQWVVARHSESAADRRTRITPTVADGRWGVSVTLRFD
jgi:membrane-associated phospholipid phosphatase